MKCLVQVFWETVWLLALLLLLGLPALRHARRWALPKEWQVMGKVESRVWQVEEPEPGSNASGASLSLLSRSYSTPAPELLRRRLLLFLADPNPQAELLPSGQGHSVSEAEERLWAVAAWRLLQERLAIATCPATAAFMQRLDTFAQNWAHSNEHKVSEGFEATALTELLASRLSLQLPLVLLRLLATLQDPLTPRVLLLEPIYGLCNRLRALAYAMSITNATGRQLVVLWSLDADLRAPLTGLFDPPKGVLLVEGQGLGSLLEDFLKLPQVREHYEPWEQHVRVRQKMKERVLNCSSPKNFFVRTFTKIRSSQPSHTDRSLYCQNLRILTNRATPEVRSIVKAHYNRLSQSQPDRNASATGEKLHRDMVGVHVRMLTSDKRDTPGKPADGPFKELGLVNNVLERAACHHRFFLTKMLQLPSSTCFFVSTDSPEALNALSREPGLRGKIFFLQPHGSDGGSSTQVTSSQCNGPLVRTLGCMILAVADLLLLSRTRSLLVSDGSTFSWVAKDVAGVPASSGCSQPAWNTHSKAALHHQLQSYLKVSQALDSGPEVPAVPPADLLAVPLRYELLGKEVASPRSCINSTLRKNQKGGAEAARAAIRAGAKAGVACCQTACQAKAEACEFWSLHLTDGLCYLRQGWATAGGLRQEPVAEPPERPIYGLSGAWLGGFLAVPIAQQAQSPFEGNPDGRVPALTVGQVLRLPRSLEENLAGLRQELARPCPEPNFRPGLHRVRAGATAPTATATSGSQARTSRAAASPEEARQQPPKTSSMEAWLSWALKQPQGQVQVFPEEELLLSTKTCLDQKEAGNWHYGSRPWFRPMEVKPWAPQQPSFASIHEGTQAGATPPPSLQEWDHDRKGELMSIKNLQSFTMVGKPHCSPGESLWWNRSRFHRSHVPALVPWQGHAGTEPKFEGIAVADSDIWRNICHATAHMLFLKGAMHLCMTSLRQHGKCEFVPVQGSRSSRTNSSFHSTFHRLIAESLGIAGPLRAEAFLGTSQSKPPRCFTLVLQRIFHWPTATQGYPTYRQDLLTGCGLPDHSICRKMLFWYKEKAGRRKFRARLWVESHLRNFAVEKDLRYISTELAAKDVSERPPCEQIMLFVDLALFVGVHGAAGVNVLWMPRGSVYLEIAAHLGAQTLTIQHSYYLGAAARGGRLCLQYAHVLEAGYPNGLYAEFLVLDVQELVSLLHVLYKEWLGPLLPPTVASASAPCGRGSE